MEPKYIVLDGRAKLHLNKGQDKRKIVKWYGGNNK